MNIQNGACVCPTLPPPPVCDSTQTLNPYTNVCQCNSGLVPATTAGSACVSPPGCTANSCNRVTCPQGFYIGKSTDCCVTCNPTCTNTYSQCVSNFVAPVGRRCKPVFNYTSCTCGYECVDSPCVSLQSCSACNGDTRCNWVSGFVTDNTRVTTYGRCIVATGGVATSICVAPPPVPNPLPPPEPCAPLTDVVQSQYVNCVADQSVYSCYIDGVASTSNNCATVTSVWRCIATNGGTVDTVKLASCASQSINPGATSTVTPVTKKEVRDARNFKFCLHCYNYCPRFWFIYHRYCTDCSWLRVLSRCFSCFYHCNRSYGF